VTVYDPLAYADEVEHEYNIKLAETMPVGPFDAIVLAVKHDEIASIPEADFRAKLVPGGLLYDMKYVLPVANSDIRL
jgi:UDP-N-acetyl-D-glucosamine/UDP-N-acetyl-D-galactosamine dehydrogenase